MKIALLGAESTGKSQLAEALAGQWTERGVAAEEVQEYLRTWCEQRSRTPLRHEQHYIAQTQRARIEDAVSRCEIVIADTTPLMTAVYSEFVFGDDTLYAEALAYQRSFDLTLLTGLDLPWMPDGIQRDGPHVRATVDALLRQRLQQAGIVFETVYGLQDERTSNAMRAILRTRNVNGLNSTSAGNAEATKREERGTSEKAWRWSCDKCSDPDCEHRLFRSLLQSAQA